MISALAPSDRAVTVPTADGSATTTHAYHLRGLRAATSEEGQEHRADIARWTEFCASVFGYKPNPPPASYFARHYCNDPRRDPTLVRVLIHCLGDDEEERLDGEIVSSVRIFRRTLSTGSGNAKIEAGGIGEVCTSPNHQRRGLSKILLKDALNIMSASCRDGEGGMSCSLLHASPNFRPVYSKVGGYRSVRSEWSLVSVNLQHLTNSKKSEENDVDEWSIRHANFPEDALSLQQLHSEYSEKRFITIVRSVQYWEEYVSAELGDTLWVLTKLGTDGENRIAAWMSVRTRGDRYQLREFGVDKSSSNTVPTLWAMERLLGVTLDSAGGNVCSENEVSLLLPTFVLSEMKEEVANSDQMDAMFFDVDAVTEENDDGWMYVNFDDSRPSVLELTTRDADPIPHLIWPTDSF